MKISKVAAGIAGVALVMGASSAAVAAPKPPTADDKPLAESNTVSRTTVAKPGDIVSIEAAINELSELADKLGTSNDLASKTSALQGAKTGQKTSPGSCSRALAC